jgi:phosphatidylglycerol lysyltransferase
VDRAGAGRPLRQLAPPLVGAALFAAALAVLHGELRAVRWADVAAARAALPRGRLWLALGFTALDYAVLAAYDVLAVSWAGHALRRGWVAVAGFVSYAVSNSLGFGMLSGAAVRFRFYARWGVSALDLSRIVLFQTTTFWLGLFVLGGASLAFAPHPWVRPLPGAPALRGAGLVLLALALAYAALPFVRREPIRLRSFELPVPRPPVVAAQLALSTLDWTLAAAVLHALLPSSVPFREMLGAFLVAQIAGLVSHVPGGLGVFETVMALALQPWAPVYRTLPALVLFRVVYYVVPLVLALAVLLAEEARARRVRVARLGGALAALGAAVAPRVLAALTFAAGAVLLFSGATPAAAGRLDALSAFVPLPVLELSHFAGSVIGVWLLFVSRGVWRRLDAAWALAVAGLAAGIAASLLKGADWEEATLLALLLAAFYPSRREFDRRAAFFAGRLDPGFALAVLAVVGASLWLAYFSFRHVEYSHELWWRFELDGEAPRALRASVGAMVGLLAAGAARLLSPAPPEVPRPSEAELAEAERIVSRQPATMPLLALMGDKALLFDEARTGFLMYGVAGRSWVALGDPVGPEPVRRELVRRFLGRVDDYAGRPIFYQVEKEALHLYADFGLTFVKLGEEARVPLGEWSLEGPDRKPFRNARSRLQREGGRFVLLSREEVAARLAELRGVSDEWLSHRGASEKGFSLGFFDEGYVSRFPAAAIERGGRLVAFATLWPGAGRCELSVDLMRHSDAAPRSTMEVLFAELLLWGRAESYRWFNLGMAPLSGLEASPVAPLWSKLGRLVYRRGEALYNFQGLRAFKEKFDPVWEPRYLAYPGGLALPRVMADVSALVAGGYTRIFR